MDCNEPDILSGPQKENEEKCRSPRGSASEMSQVVIDGAYDPSEGKILNNVEESGVVSSTEHKGQSPNASSVDIDDEECQTPKLSSVNKCEMDVDYSRFESSSVDVSESGSGVKDEEDLYLVPDVGIEFESEDHAYKCYSRYAVLEGFSIRKDFVNKSRINGAVVSRRYTCYRQGYRPAKPNTNARKPRQETRTGCLAHMTIARQPNDKFRVTHFETKHNHEFVTSSTTHMLPSQKRLTFAQAVEDELANHCAIDGVPKLGMGFDSEDQAYEFYNAYAGRVGFSVRKDYVNRSKIDGAVASRRFICFREGFRQRDKRDMNVKRPRKETRIGCLAQLVISRQSDGKYRVTHFEEKHNHELVAPCRIHMLRSQKRLVVTQVEGSLVDSSNGQPLSAPELLCKTVGDCNDLYYNPIDYKSKLPFKCTREIREGEGGKMQQYFLDKHSKNPSFFYAMQPDADGQITNVFWADAKMLMDYGDFGDVVCFDTSYKLHKDCRPFALFIGINHHKQIVIFGAALLYDETLESYNWLFRTFIEAMSSKKPKTILTDQDVVMAEAINTVLRGTHHRTCLWHLYQNAAKQLGYMIAGSSSFINDLSHCFFDLEEEEDFSNAWKAMLDLYGLWENDWLHEIYENREKWAMPYRRHIFCADIESALRFEAFTTNLRKYLNPDSDVIPLLKHLAKVVNSFHYKELKANYDMNQHPPKLMGDVIFLKHARDFYTPPVFELFQHEYETCLNIIVNQCTHSGALFQYKVSLYGQQREYTVTFNSADETIACNCMKFEFVGVLCSHALKVLDYRNIKLLPTKYLLKRWTKDARV
ncbi:protein FAR1-RELATED SEQUENCE 5-like [Humulus lupulus]|uniref:protein FAR1-RELATED SEQUENCE 5-like n=1 Tax=Humulus lupulus TaxID=3486 RepID=UPI002B408D7E|nr:protein FAR1-RELATED SEQUENCE 5-like [Humulus lupulus]